MSCPSIITIVDKYYEHRTPEEHSIVVGFLEPHFPTLNTKMRKLISFYLRSLRGQQICTHKEFTSQSYVITGIPETLDLENPQIITQMKQVARDKSVTIPEGTFGITLDYAHYLNCMALGDTSIEEEVSFMHTSEYLCSIPRKRFYQILRNSKILSFSTSQIVYFEGQKIESGESGSGVYFVRRGEFGYFKESQRKNSQIQTLRFSKGHIFGTLELHGNQNSIQHNLTRKFTVKCKSHFGLIYNFADQIFSSQIKPYCEATINARQNKLMKYLDGNMQKINKTRNSVGPLLSQTLTRGFSVGDASNVSKQLPALTRTRFSIPNSTIMSTNSKMLKSQMIEQQGLKRSGNFSSAKEGPLKNYPMASQRCNFTDSEFRQFERLNKNRAQCEKIKKLKGNETSASKGEILFSFFKNTWSFDKQKRLANRRYQII